MKKIDIDYLDNNLRKSIENDIKKVSLYHSRNYGGIRAGFFSIPRHVFCIIDYLGYIESGNKGSTIRSEDFIKKYFPTNYSSYAEVLVAIWRQGTVHQFAPKKYVVKYPGESFKKISLRWLSNNSNKKINRKENLKTYSMLGKKSTEVYLVLNNCQLVDDLLDALTKFVSAVKMNPKKKSECERRIEEVMGDFPISEIMGTNRQNAVSSQICNAWKFRAGLINKRLSVVKRF